MHPFEHSRCSGSFQQSECTSRIEEEVKGDNLPPVNEAKNSELKQLVNDSNELGKAVLLVDSPNAVSSVKSFEDSDKLPNLRNFPKAIISPQKFKGDAFVDMEGQLSPATSQKSFKLNLPSAKILSRVSSSSSLKPPGQKGPLLRRAASSFLQQLVSVKANTANAKSVSFVEKVTCVTSFIHIVHNFNIVGQTRKREETVLISLPGAVLRVHSISCIADIDVYIVVGYEL